MRIVSRTISDRALSEECFVFIDEHDLTAGVQFVHDLTLASPNLRATPVSGAMTLRTRDRRNIEDVHRTLLHESNLNLVCLAPNICRRGDHDNFGFLKR